MRGTGWESFLVRAFNCLKSMQKQSEPSFFLTKTTTLHHGLLLGRMAPASNISFRCSLTSSTCVGGILRKRSLKGGVSGSLKTILCVTALVCPISCFSREKRSWYSFRRLRAWAASSSGHISNPTRSNFSIKRACLSASVRAGGLSWGLDTPTIPSIEGIWFAGTILTMGVPLFTSTQLSVLFCRTTAT